VERYERQSRLEQKSFICVQIRTSVWLSQIDGQQFCTVNILFKVKHFCLIVALMCLDYDTSRSVHDPLIWSNCKWKTDLWSPVFLYVLGWYSLCLIAISGMQAGLIFQLVGFWKEIGSVFTVLKVLVWECTVGLDSSSYIQFLIWRYC